MADSLPPVRSDSAQPEGSAVVQAMLTLFRSLPPADQRHVLQQMSGETPVVQPVSVRRVSNVTAQILKFVPKGEQFAVGDIRDKVLAALEAEAKTKDEEARATAKDVYNAMSYLAKTGRVRRVSHGKYILDNGMLVESSDDLGLGPTRNEEHDAN